MFKKAVAVAMTATMILSMAVIASADAEVAIPADANCTDAALLAALNSDPASVKFAVTANTDTSVYNVGYGDCAIKVHVAGEADDKVHQYNFTTAEGATQSWTVTGKDVFDGSVDSVYNNGWTPFAVEAGAQVDWVSCAAWGSGYSDFKVTATVSGAAATGVVVPVAVVTLLGVSAAGAMAATKKRS
ncbi:MAG: hypothetical protein J5825_08095 [Lachnospiraceae bacterium]|nr:hypothetical protein [Lachnospiraceae bacterium]